MNKKKGTHVSLDVNNSNKLRSASMATRSCITTGESFPDGAMIELVSGPSRPNQPDLLLWSKGKATVAPRVAHNGNTYEAPLLDPILYRAVRLPAGISDYGAARKLFVAITELFKRHLNAEEREANLLASFSVSTWLCDRLPTAPALLVSGPDDQMGIVVLCLLSCVCRRPLMLAEVTPADMRSLPLQLTPTLLLNQPRFTLNLLRIFHASSYRGLLLPGKRGTVLDLCGPKAIFCGSDPLDHSLTAGMIQVALPPSQSLPSGLDEQVQGDIAGHFQPRLLRYRLKNLAKVRTIDVAFEFSLPTRQLASALAMCFPEDSNLAKEIIQLLRSQDEEGREQRFLNVNYAIVEILLGLVHNPEQDEIRVDQLAKDVNVLLRSRGEILEYSAEEIGWKLRSMNIPRHTTSGGREVPLGRETSQLIHRLAQAYGLPCLASVEPGCPECSRRQQAVSKDVM